MPVLVLVFKKIGSTVVPSYWRGYVPRPHSGCLKPQS